MFEFKVTGKLLGRGRRGVFTTPHGDLHTPVFMPVGTHASVKSVHPTDLEKIGAQIILANNYHLYLRPGSDGIAKLGGLHAFMNWHHPILTDSGGFQVWSLGQRKPGHSHLYGCLAKIKADGVEFRSHLDGSLHFLSPETAIESEIKLGADIIMAFDQCTSDTADKNEARAALELTNSWLTRSIQTWRQSPHAGNISKSARSSSELVERDADSQIGANKPVATQFSSQNHAQISWRATATTRHVKDPEYFRGTSMAFGENESHSQQALFGIIQGALHEDLRKEAAQFVVSQNLPGVAIGGETIGYNMTGTKQVLDWIADLLPENKPRYTMGLGLKPSDVLTAISLGIDMFDCVAPTRLARNGALYTGHVTKKGNEYCFESDYANERINIGNKEFGDDTKPIDSNCDCPTCLTFSRAYLHHLFRSKELLYYSLASVHNLRMMIKTVEDAVKLGGVDV